MTGRPALVASDLDGTLLDPSGQVSARTRAALQRLWDDGIDTVFVTARPPRWVDALADWVGGHGLAICGNGAFLYDVEARTIVETHPLDPAHLGALVADLRAAVPGIVFAAERAEGFWVEGGAFDIDEALPAGARVGPIEEVDGRVGKLLARAPHLPDAEFATRVVEVVADRAVVADSGAHGLAEIGPVGVSKASALQAWCARRGIEPAQVWAFGDMPNDLPMLEWAGTSFAMGNAHPRVTAAATHTCPSNAADGVAVVLEQLVR